MSAVESLACPNCSADLDVPDGVSILKCRYCGSKLQVRESANARGLALLERGVQQIVHNTGRTAEGVNNLVLMQQQHRAEAHQKWANTLEQLLAEVHGHEQAYSQLEQQIAKIEERNQGGWHLLIGISCLPVGVVGGAIWGYVGNKPNPDSYSSGLDPFASAFVGGFVGLLIGGFLCWIFYRSADWHDKRAVAEIEPLREQQETIVAAHAQAQGNAQRWREREPL